MNANQTDVVRSVTAAIDLTDLRSLVERPGPFLTVLVPSPSALDDAQQRLDIRWRNVRSELDGRWPDERIAELDALIEEIPHHGGAGIAIVQPSEGDALVDFLIEPVARTVVHVDPLPRLATVVESRQRTLPHIVVDADRTGATILAFDGTSLVAEDDVEGETLHIHRNRQGGWSHRRYQQRAENQWEQNADDVAEAVVDFASQFDPVLIAVAGPVRARSMIAEALADRVADDLVVPIDAGDADGIGDEVVRLLSDHVARAQRTLAERLRDGLAQDTAANADGTIDALVAGRVETLLVDDDDADEPVLDGSRLGGPAGARMVDAAIRAALLSDASVVVMPSVAAMEGRIASLLRW